MGALLSIPFLAVPSIGTIGAFAASCCGAATCSAVCSACGSCRNSLATRIAYALLLLVNSIVSWLMLTDWAVKKLQHLTLEYMTITCNGKACFGFVAVHRMNFALGAFHAVLAISLLGVNSTRDKRATLQNGFWGPKLVGWVSLIVITFLIPDGFFITWGNYFAMFGALLFVLLGLVLLVDLAHSWAEYALEKIETLDSRFWQYLLVGSTASMYLGSLAMTIVMYIFFAHSGCAMNQASITINLIMVILVSIISVNTKVQEHNSRAGLAQAAMVTLYCTYLTMSAVGMEPDDQQCNPLVRARGTRTASVVIGAIITFLTVAYTTTRAATYGLALGSPAHSYTQLRSDDREHGLVTQQPESRREMRTAALRAAVDSGSLPASALDDDDDESDDGRGRDDERVGTQYNYSMFHVIFLLSTAWVATLLTMNLEDQQGDFVPVGRTYWASWVKIVSSWVCYAIYTWSLTAPVLLPDRFGY